MILRKDREIYWIGRERVSNITLQRFTNMQQPLWTITIALIIGKIRVCLAISLAQWFSNISMYPNHLEGLVKYKLLSPTSSVSDSLRSGGFAFLTNPQVMLMPLVQRLQLEKHYPEITWNTSNTLSPQRA